MNLKKALTEYLQTELNAVWQNITGETINRIKFATDFQYTGNDLVLLDESGQPYFNQYGFAEKFIPCAVLSFMGDRQEIPNTLIIDAVIPIEIQCGENFLDEMMTTLSVFQDNVNGKIIKLMADFQGIGDGFQQEYSVLMSYNLPDDDDFKQVIGINAKIIDFQITATITIDMAYGNDIAYELSLDNGTTFFPIVKIEPNSLLAKSLYTDQVINTNKTTSINQFSTWSLELSILLKKQDELYNLLYLTDMNYTDLGMSVDPLKNMQLKTIYMFKDYLYEKQIGAEMNVIWGKDFKIKFNDIDLTNYGFSIYNITNTINTYPCVSVSNGELSYFYNSTSHTALYQNGEWQPSLTNTYFKWDKTTLTLTNLNTDTNFNGVSITSGSTQTISDVFSIFSRNYFIKNVIPESLGYSGALGTFMTLSLSLKERV
jgi:hypothetical protein